LFGTYLLTYWRVYVVVIFCRVYAVFLSYFRYSTLRDIYVILTLRLSPYTVHIMAYNFYIDKVLFTVQIVSVNFKSFACYIYLSYVVTWSCIVILITF